MGALRCEKGQETWSEAGNMVDGEGIGYLPDHNAEIRLNFTCSVYSEVWDRRNFQN